MILLGGHTEKKSQCGGDSLGEKLYEELLVASEFVDK